MNLNTHRHQIDTSALSFQDAKLLEDRWRTYGSCAVAEIETYAENTHTIAQNTHMPAKGERARHKHFTARHPSFS